MYGRFELPAMRPAVKRGAGLDCKEEERSN